ncbi:MAG: hypothetical protein DM484_28515 [Candidatus Methylumidiphilus alinenensis]|uniref:TraG N-terminal Proteobacteria domain-containing protein n=1 Tax=Candidatus Methylumidiphilus alinenensis TaxID=2202197 RepID=A0A2W4SF47_9GAMM|nr:MAG: hypothetical protein DM484_28515 [Candidatus Methylumidiphilus alinenensis]
MEVGSAIELYTTLLGWILYDKLWDALAETGVAYIPFLALIVRNFALSWEKYGMEGAAASMRGMEIQLAAMLTVVALAGSPVISLQSSDLSYTAPCGGATVSGGNSGTGYDQTFQLGNNQATVPAWWRAVMAVSAGFSNAAIAATPCQGDLRRMDYRMGNTVIKDLDLKAQLDDFYQDCFLRARSQFIRQGQSLPSGYPPDDIDWPGSQYFQDTDGYYNNANINLAMRAHREIPNFPFDPARDAEYGGSSPSGWGKPTCYDWWANETAGLRQRLVQQIDSGLLNSIVTTVSAKMNGTTVKSVQDDLIRKLYVQDMKGALNVQSHDENSSAFVRALSDFGLMKQGVETSSTVYALKQAAPIGQSLILMTVYLCLPFLLVFSSFSIQAVMLASLGVFALRFLTALWALATWLDTSMIEALGIEWWRFLTNFNPSISVVVVNTVSGLLYIGMPLIWFTVIGWTGHTLASVGLVASINDPIGKGAAGAAAGIPRTVGRAVSGIARTKSSRSVPKPTVSKNP